MAHNKQKYPHIIMVFITIIALAGCGLTGQPEAVGQLTPVTVQLAWVHSVEYSGFYIAQENGNYAAENLTVQLNPLGEVSPIDAVAQGQADFGITSADTLLAARANGAPVVAIATIYQRSPVAFISLAEKNITRPQDLIGATVMVHFEGTTGLVYNAMLKAVGIDASQVNSVPRTDFSNDPLLNGQVDAMDAFVVNQPVQLSLQGHQVNAILAADYGVDVYANVIFTSEEKIANNPELIERFLRATIQGMQEAVNNPTEAARLAVQHNQELNLEAETESLQRALPLITPAGSRPGLMTDENWQITRQILIEQNVLDESFPVEPAYTLSFLEKAHNQLATK